MSLDGQEELVLRNLYDLNRPMSVDDFCKHTSAALEEEGGLAFSRFDREDYPYQEALQDCVLGLIKQGYIAQGSNALIEWAVVPIGMFR